MSEYSRCLDFTQCGGTFNATFPVRLSEHRPLRREEEELQKINSGMGAVILKDLKEHAKYRKWKQSHMDPRKSSRTPSASREPVYRLRYESPLGASPSRHLDHQKPFTDDETTTTAGGGGTFDRSTSYRGSVGRSIGQAPSYNGKLRAGAASDPIRDGVQMESDGMQTHFVFFSSVES